MSRPSVKTNPEHVGDFLSSLSSKARSQMFSLAENVAYEEGDVVFRQGDPSRYLYVVKAGRVAIEIHLPSKGSRRIQTVGPGDVFSWSALIKPYTETASARATHPTEVWRIKREILISTCRKDCAFGFELYRALACAISARLMATRLQLLDVFAVP